MAPETDLIRRDAPEQAGVTVRPLCDGTQLQLPVEIPKPVQDAKLTFRRQYCPLLEQNYPVNLGLMIEHRARFLRQLR